MSVYWLVCNGYHVASAATLVTPEAIAADYSGASYCSTSRYTVSRCYFFFGPLTKEVLARETVYLVGCSASFSSMISFDLIIAKYYALFFLAAMGETLSELSNIRGEKNFLSIAA